MDCSLEAIFTGHTDAVYALEKGIMEHTFLSSSGDGFVATWNKISNTFERPAAKAESSVYAIHLIPENSHLLIGSRSGEIYVTDLFQRKPVKAMLLHKQPIFDIQVCSGTGQIWAASGDGSISVWTAGYELIRQIQLTNMNVRNIALSEENRLALIACSDHTIRVFNSDTLEQIEVLKEHQNSVFTCAWINGTSFLSGSRDAHVFLWTLDNCEWKVETKIPAHNFTVNDIKLSPDKRYFATAGRDKTVKIWDTQTLSLLKVLDTKFERAHTHSVNKLLWLDNETLLSCGDDKSIIKWHVKK